MYQVSPKGRRPSEGPVVLVGRECEVGGRRGGEQGEGAPPAEVVGVGVRRGLGAGAPAVPGKGEGRGGLIII